MKNTNYNNNMMKKLIIALVIVAVLLAIVFVILLIRYSDAQNDSSHNGNNINIPRTEESSNENGQSEAGLPQATEEEKNTEESVDYESIVSEDDAKDDENVTNETIRVVIDYIDMPTKPTITEDFKKDDYILLLQNNNGADFDKYFDSDGNVVMERACYGGNNAYRIYDISGSYGFEIYVEPDMEGFHNEDLYGFEVSVYKGDELIFSGTEDDYEYSKRYPTGLWAWGIRIENGNVQSY